jgi:inhibitor of KinA
MQIAPLGDSAVLITLGDEISRPTHAKVWHAFSQLRAAALPWVTDLVPGFASLAVHYEPLLLRVGGSERQFDAVVREIEQALVAPGPVRETESRVIEIPVCYGGEFGPDLEELAGARAMHPRDVVRLHTEPEYLVYMLGFLPGFPYLGGLAPALATPRRASPRTHVPAGSVGIGGEQTGVYPLESPGGWHLIGRTPLRLFTPRQDPPTLLSMGDRVRFRAVTEQEFREFAPSAS